MLKKIPLGIAPLAPIPVIHANRFQNKGHPGAPKRVFVKPQYPTYPQNEQNCRLFHSISQNPHRTPMFAAAHRAPSGTIWQHLDLAFVAQGDKVVKMNIDGVDASIEGIVQCDVPSSWASLKVDSEALAKMGKMGKMAKMGKMGKMSMEIFSGK